ncbi:MAG: trypsin-like peptidase domain-containing protein [Candidatus Latescibacterota bacterium]|nr:trypsin-like peptidase domain-containing protein [Candidatus Latescibacterota bacterium]
MTGMALCGALLMAHSAWAQSEEIAASRRNALVRAVEWVQPAVVSVHAVTRESYIYRSADPFLEYFFPLSPLSHRLYRGERSRVSGGSGVIVSDSGQILTNAHVVGDPEKLERAEVSLTDGRVLRVRSVEVDHSLDLAVLRVAESGLPVASLDEPGHILVGEWAIAIGNPFDLGPTVSVGVISAIDRDFQEPQGNYYYRDMIQTDAAINPGNSGGPLVNANGEVLGINSFIYTGGDYNFGSIGIGFAIPISAARRFLEELDAHGRIRKPWHGIVGLQDLTPRLADFLELDSTDGAIVTQVAVDSPAFSAELTRGDVIVGVNGEPVRSKEEAKGLLGGLRVADTCGLQIVRSGSERSLAFAVAELPRAGSRWD